jgi:hypothetical protein
MNANIIIKLQIKEYTALLIAGFSFYLKNQTANFNMKNNDRLDYNLATSELRETNKIQQ